MRMMTLLALRIACGLAMAGDASECYVHAASAQGAIDNTSGEVPPEVLGLPEKPSAIPQIPRASSAPKGPWDASQGDLIYLPVFDRLVGTWKELVSDPRRDGTIQCTTAARGKAIYMTWTATLRDDRLDTPEIEESNTMWCATREQVYAYHFTLQGATRFRGKILDANLLDVMWRGDGGPVRLILDLAREDTLVVATIRNDRAGEGQKTTFVRSVTTLGY